MGNCLGIGAYEADNSISPLDDQEYLDLVQPYLDKAEIGMFIGVKNTSEKNIAKAAANGLKFLRIGANAGDGKKAIDGIKLVKKYGMKCRYSMMKGYILSASDLSEEAKMLADAGLDEVTIMDSAGTMYPEMVKTYCKALTSKVSIPVAFHGHNNLGLSVANALAALEGGATVLDCGLMGMARSAGNCATELITAVLQQQGMLEYVDFLTLLHFIDDELAPAMEEKGYHDPVKPGACQYAVESVFWRQRECGGGAVFHFCGKNGCGSDRNGGNQRRVDYLYAEKRDAGSAAAEPV